MADEPLHWITGRGGVRGQPRGHLLNIYTVRGLVCAFIGFVGVQAIPAIADDALAPSVPSCDYGEWQENSDGLTPELWPKSAATFKKLCLESNGALVNGQDPRLQLRLRPRANVVMPVSKKVVALAGRGPALVVMIVETDGRVSSVGLLKSTGDQKLDNAWLDYSKDVIFKPGFHLDSNPVRAYYVAKFEIIHRIQCSPVGRFECALGSAHVR
ncbi:MAG TPA: hypothetical protein VGM97_11690 [Steroidobacteraceae bacterium]